MPPPSGTERLDWLIHFIAQPSHIALGIASYTIGLLLYRIVIKPRYISRLRKAPGPPVQSTLLGHFHDVITREPGTAMAGWAKEYGPVVRTVGPLGRERVLFMKSEALQKILVSDWTENERVSLPCYLHTCNPSQRTIQANVYAGHAWARSGLWLAHCDW